MKKLICILMLVISTNVFASQVVVSVPGMFCSMCVYGMRTAFKDVVNDPEKDVLVNLDKKTVTLNLLSTLSDEEIKKRIGKAGSSYKASQITRL